MTTDRLRPSQLEWVADRLMVRDWEIMEGVNRLRLLTGAQIERLYFFDLKAGRSRTASRSRVLHRLVEWRVLVPLARRIGGAGRGSTTLSFALDSAGVRIMRERLLADGTVPRVRRPGAPGERTVRHILAVSECFVSLIELGRLRDFTVVKFQAEPASWWPNGLGGHLKPDAYALLESGTIRDHWWIEVDLATESLPAVKKQLLAYLDFARRGQVGPGRRIMPRVAIATVTAARQQALEAFAGRLPEPASRLFCIVQIHKLPSALYQILRE